MSNQLPPSRIENLRHLVAAIGKRQVEYLQFFPHFADRLERELGEYLGDATCVALSSAAGEFSFDHRYRHDGLGFDEGRFRVPLMVRIKNLNDEGDLQVRIKVYFTKKEERLTAYLDGELPLQFTLPDLLPLCEYLYRYLCSLFEEGQWFNLARAEYGGSGIGFIRGK